MLTPLSSLHSQYCSNNIVTTIMDLKDALWEDVLTVGRLIAVCFGNVCTLEHSNTYPLRFFAFAVTLARL